jgi:drug/metabolite transporter (DMT)-like permease
VRGTDLAILTVASLLSCRSRVRCRVPPTLFLCGLATAARWRSAEAEFRLLPAMRRHWRLGLAGGTLQLGSYGIAIWAMTVAPIAIVAALRETSVLFGALIAIIILKEPLRASRVAAALLIVAGLTLIRLY